MNPLRLWSSLCILAALTGCLLFVPGAPSADELAGYRCGDNGCLEDYVCVDGVCVVDTSCNGTGTCADGESCVDAVCLPPPDVLDVLIVVDNSGSMQEEQSQLAAAFPSFVAALSNAGADWRVGVITTDVGLCDNRLPAALGGDEWGFRPQRGCLHGDGPPGLETSLVLDASNANAALWLSTTLANVATFGSQFERGLDAVEIFLDVAARRSPGCEGDVAAFRRAGARLIVVFVTDEDDCSHRDGSSGFPDENIGEVCALNVDFFTGNNANLCYTNPELLAEVASYTFPGTRLAVVGGAVGGVGTASASGCSVDGAGAAIDGCVLTLGTLWMAAEIRSVLTVGG